VHQISTKTGGRFHGIEGKASFGTYVNQTILWIYISKNTIIQQLLVTVSYAEFQNNLFTDLGADTGSQTEKGIHTGFLRTSKNEQMFHSE
jgi:hypothetical protein